MQCSNVKTNFEVSLSFFFDSLTALKWITLASWLVLFGVYLCCIEPE